MSESSASGNFHAHPGNTGPLEYASKGSGRPAQGPARLVRVGGAIGIAACIIGLLIFLVGCMGLDGVFPFSVLPVGAAVVGMLVTLAGAFQEKSLVIEDTHVLAALFANALGLIGGLLELAVWLKWPVFYPAA